MTDSPATPSPEHDNDAPPKVPGWVKALGAALVVVALILLVAMLLMGGEHGPGRHGG